MKEYILQIVDDYEGTASGPKLVFNPHIGYFRYQSPQFIRDQRLPEVGTLSQSVRPFSQYIVDLLPPNQVLSHIEVSESRERVIVEIVEDKTLPAEEVYAIMETLPNELLEENISDPRSITRANYNIKYGYHLSNPIICSFKSPDSSIQTHSHRYKREYISFLEQLYRIPDIALPYTIKSISGSFKIDSDKNVSEIRTEYSLQLTE